jgi:hypothetical protein
MPDVDEISPDDIFRAASPTAIASANLGLLQDLPGRWEGRGFNLIARPAQQGVATNPVFFWNSMAHERRSSLPRSVATFPIGGHRDHQTSARHPLPADRCRLRGWLVHS